jgi:hypothetical protein
MAGEPYLTIYELENTTLKESLVTANPRAQGAGWDAHKHEITCSIVDSSVPRGKAADFMSWYAQSRSRLGWKTIAAK